MIVTANVNLTLELAETLAYGITSQTLQSKLLPAYSLTNGTASGQIDLRWEKAGATAVTLAAAGTVTYTLSALTDALGRAVAFAEVAVLAIYCTTRAAADYLTIGNAGTNPWTAIVGGATQTFQVRDLELKVATDAGGFAVGAGTSDQLKIVNSGAASVTFAIVLLGRSA